MAGGGGCLRFVEKYDLILLDLNMPGKDGKENAKNQKSRKQLFFHIHQSFCLSCK